MYGYSKIENCRVAAQEQANETGCTQYIYVNGFKTYSFSKLDLGITDPNAPFIKELIKPQI